MIVNVREIERATYAWIWELRTPAVLSFPLCASAQGVRASVFAELVCADFGAVPQRPRCQQWRLRILRAAYWKWDQTTISSPKS